MAGSLQVLVWAVRARSLSAHLHSRNGTGVCAPLEMAASSCCCFLLGEGVLPSRSASQKWAAQKSRHVSELQTDVTAWRAPATHTTPSTGHQAQRLSLGAGLASSCLNWALSGPLGRVERGVRTTERGVRGLKSPPVWFAAWWFREHLCSPHPEASPLPRCPPALRALAPAALVFLTSSGLDLGVPR